jgi:hypothetical protein
MIGTRDNRYESAFALLYRNGGESMESFESLGSEQR